MIIYNKNVVVLTLMQPLSKSGENMCS